MSFVEAEERLRQLLVPDTKLRLSISDGNPNNGMLHVRAVVDGDQVIIRQWSRCKQRWIYRIEWIPGLAIQYRESWITPARKSKEADVLVGRCRGTPADVARDFAPSA